MAQVFPLLIKAGEFILEWFIAALSCYRLTPCSGGGGGSACVFFLSFEGNLGPQDPRKGRIILKNYAWRTCNVCNNYYFKAFLEQVIFWSRGPILCFFFFGMCQGTGGILFREYCFGRENSLSSAANSVSSARNSVSSCLPTNNRLKGTHWVRSPKLSEPRKTHWVGFLKPYSPKPYSARLRCVAGPVCIVCVCLRSDSAPALLMWSLRSCQEIFQSRLPTKTRADGSPAFLIVVIGISSRRKLLCVNCQYLKCWK